MHRPTQTLSTFSQPNPTRSRGTVSDFGTLPLASLVVREEDSAFECDGEGVYAASISSSDAVLHVGSVETTHHHVKAFHCCLFGWQMASCSGGASHPDGGAT